MGTLTIRLDEQLEQDLTRLATRTHRTKSDLAREMLRKHLALAKLRELRGKLMPYAEAAGYLTDGDVFQDVSRRSSWTVNFRQYGAISISA